MALLFLCDMRVCLFPLCERRGAESVCVKMCALSRSGNFVFNDLLHTSAVAVLFKFERSNLQQRATQNTQRTQNVRVAVFSETENRSTKKYKNKNTKTTYYKKYHNILDINCKDSLGFFINFSGLVSCARVCVRCV